MALVIDFCGLKFSGLSHQRLFCDDGEFKFVITVNSEFIVKAGKDREFSNLINSSLATFDGQIPYLFAKLVSKDKIFEKISGSDLIYDACAYAQANKKKIFLLGGDASSNSMAVEKLKKSYAIDVAGYSPPYVPYPFPKEHNQKILHEIEKFNPDYLFVGFGAVKQEYWIKDNLSFLKANNIQLAVGCGGTFDFVSGRVKRAPGFVQKIGMEGVWRFIVEPKFFRLKRLSTSLMFFPIFYSHHIAKTSAGQ